MSKSLDRVLQPDGSYKWEEVELIHSTKKVEPVVQSKPVVEPKKEALEVEKETTADFETMTKTQLETYGRTIGLELDKRHTKADLIAELKNFTSAN
ncbi:hypothetical protein MedDCM-OCT-S13-C2-cds36 [uncultured Mediterranean phage MEDS1 group]|nr:hypothetical protein MedDCM-OCT-S13-C2-cds36 [uncultured Mediterranean phage MEDS1 group]